ncbi:MAG: hypothetical protein DMF68_04850 [Acidobacteria bacterium]|nr:MAG: hypothetical protein DMF68_04850 [Acidobacteriota bacterium]
MRATLYKIRLITFAALISLNTSCASVNSNTNGQQQTRERRVGAKDQSQSNANSKDGTNRTEMQGENRETASPFYTALKRALDARKLRLEDVCDTSDPVSRRVLEDYGAMFLADQSVMPPPVCVFTSEADVLEFQRQAKPTAAQIGGSRIELQPAAMKALLAAREEARAAGLDITPRGGTEAARRSYDDTVRLWNTRFFPALAHWNKLGRLSKEQVEHLRSLALHDQVGEVLELEKTGIYFNTDFSKSILYSIAAPGSSQHIAMLALDVEQFSDERVRKILARHGWFQTVKSDMPHFTYLGLDERDLPARGLRALLIGKQLFWIPNVSGE